MDWQVGVLVAVEALSVAYVFARVFDKAGFTKALLATSVLIDFYLFLMWILGVDRPLWMMCTRLGCINITALSLFLPLKLVFTVYLAVNQAKLSKTLG